MHDIAAGSLALPTGRAITRAAIVDKNPDSQLAAALEAWGFHVNHIDAGTETLARIDAFSPDIVFLDHSLTGAGRQDALHALRNQHPDTAVVLTSSRYEGKTIDLASQPAYDWLGKPFDSGEFETMLDRTITRLVLARQTAALRRHFGLDLPPGVAPSPDPQVSGFDLAARCVPADGGPIGGDFYEWQEADPSRLSLVVGDVMGKGMPAALMMETVRAVMRAVVPQNRPAEALQRAARSLDPDLVRSGSFVTVFHAQIDFAAKRLSYSDAGHGFAMFRRATGAFRPLPHMGLPLGVAEDERYREESIRLEPGDLLVVYSDGLTQARPDLLADQSAFGDILDPACSAAELADRCIELGRERGPLADDLTIAVVRYNGLTAA
jgi:sigma-B regulation protein RsbU (phosphoserine phosphatase)